MPNSTTHNLHKFNTYQPKLNSYLPLIQVGDSSNMEIQYHLHKLKHYLHKFNPHQLNLTPSTPGEDYYVIECT